MSSRPSDREPALDYDDLARRLEKAYAEDDLALLAGEVQRLERENRLLRARLGRALEALREIAASELPVRYSLIADRLYEVIAVARAALDEIGESAREALKEEG